MRIVPNHQYACGYEPDNHAAYITAPVSLYTLLPAVERCNVALLSLCKQLTMVLLLLLLCPNSSRSAAVNPSLLPVFLEHLQMGWAGQQEWPICNDN